MMIVMTLRKILFDFSVVMLFSLAFLLQAKNDVMRTVERGHTPTSHQKWKSHKPDDKSEWINALSLVPPP